MRTCKTGVTPHAHVAAISILPRKQGRTSAPQFKVKCDCFCLAANKKDAHAQDRCYPARTCSCYLNLAPQAGRGKPYLFSCACANMPQGCRKDEPRSLMRTQACHKDARANPLSGAHAKEHATGCGLRRQCAQQDGVTRTHCSCHRST
jgi:hypothetical protein